MLLNYVKKTTTAKKKPSSKGHPRNNEWKFKWKT